KATAQYRARHMRELAHGDEAELLEFVEGYGLETECSGGETQELIALVGRVRDHWLAPESCQCPYGTDGPGHCAADIVASGLQAGEDALQIGLVAAPEMRTAGAIQEQSVRGIDRGDGGEPDAPLGEGAKQFVAETGDIVQHFDSGDDSPCIGDGGAAEDALRLRFWVGRGHELTAMIGDRQDKWFVP